MSAEKFTEHGWPWDPTHLVLDQQFEYDTGKRGIHWISPDGLFGIYDGVAICLPGIEWDGTTAICDGEPDPLKPNFPITWKASLIHDMGCRSLNESAEFRKHFSRFEVDLWFYKELKRIRFKSAVIYYAGVTAFTLFWYVKRFLYGERKTPTSLVSG